MLHEGSVPKKLLALLKKQENLFELVEPMYQNNQISYLGKKDIAAMKLHAIETSGDRAKDFVDIYFLLKEISLEEMFECYRKKYSTDNIFNAKRSLGFFEDVPEESWNELHFIDQKVEASAIKSVIINAINDFNRKNMYCFCAFRAGYYKADH